MKVVKKSSIICTHIFLCLGVILMLYPFVFAFLGMFKTIEGFYEVGILPVPDGIGYGISNLRIIFRRSEIYRSILITLGRFAWYAAISVLISVLGGYAFAKVNFRFKKVAFYIIMSTMMIPGIALLIPQYLELMRFPLVGGNDITGHGGVGFRDNMAVLFITGWISAYNIFLVQQSLRQIGDDYREAAEIDGSSPMNTLFTIILPLSKSILVVITIYYFVAHWNAYFDAMMYITKRNKWPLQVFLRQILLLSQMGDMAETMGADDANTALLYASLKYAIIIIAALPLIIVYPLVQKFFEKGIMLGSVKG